jgi:site-specific DNA recombinase
MREKAEQGMYPGRAPFGYRNDSATRSIQVDSGKAPVLIKIYQMYATGDYSLSSLRETVLINTGVRLCRAYLEKVLKNRFYVGYFTWGGSEYKGTHSPLIDAALFERVQRVFSGHNKPKYRKHEFAFAGLLRCAHDGCTVTTELQKKKYVYYRCSHGRGKCDLPYMPEAQVSDHLGDVLKGICVPDHVARAIVESIENDQGAANGERLRKLSDAKLRLSAVRSRMDRMYDDKLDGKIDEEFWNRKMADWRTEERALQSAAESLNVPLPQNRALTAQRIFELANKAQDFDVVFPARDQPTEPMQPGKQQLSPPASSVAP